MISKHDFDELYVWVLGVRNSMNSSLSKIRYLHDPVSSAMLKVVALRIEGLKFDLSLARRSRGEEILEIVHRIQSELRLLLDDPTRGIDVGTKAEIYRLMGELAGEGKSIIFVSSYLPELLAVCDTVGVMSRGKLRELRRASDWTENEVLSVAVASDNEIEQEKDL